MRSVKIIFSLWLVCTLPAYGALAVLNCGSNDDGGSGGTGAITATVNVTGGSGHVVIVLGSFGATCSGNSMTLGNGQGDTVTIIGSQFTSNGGACVKVGYIKNATGNASATYTVTPGNSQPDRTVVACEISGADTSTPLDQGPAGVEVTGATNLVSGSITTTQADEVVFGVVGKGSFGSTLVAGSGSICSVSPGCATKTGSVDANHFAALEYLILTSTQTGTVNFTNGASTTAEVGAVSFSAPIAATGTKTPSHSSAF